MMADNPPAPALGAQAIAAMRARHAERPIVLPSGLPVSYCPVCGSAWPCDAARLYDAQAAQLAAARSVLARFVAHPVPTAADFEAAEEWLSAEGAGAVGTGEPDGE